MASGSSSRTARGGEREEEEVLVDRAPRFLGSRLPRRRRRSGRGARVGGMLAGLLALLLLHGARASPDETSYEASGWWASSLGRGIPPTASLRPSGLLMIDEAPEPVVHSDRQTDKREESSSARTAAKPQIALRFGATLESTVKRTNQTKHPLAEGSIPRAEPSFMIPSSAVVQIRNQSSTSGWVFSMQTITSDVPSQPPSHALPPSPILPSSSTLSPSLVSLKVPSLSKQSLSSSTSASSWSLLRGTKPASNPPYISGSAPVSSRAAFGFDTLYSNQPLSLKDPSSTSVKYHPHMEFKAFVQTTVSKKPSELEPNTTQNISRQPSQEPPSFSHNPAFVRRTTKIYDDDSQMQFHGSSSEESAIRTAQEKLIHTKVDSSVASSLNDKKLVALSSFWTVPPTNIPSTPPTALRMNTDSPGTTASTVTLLKLLITTIFSRKPPDRLPSSKPSIRPDTFTSLNSRNGYTTNFVTTSNPERRSQETYTSAIASVSVQTPMETRSFFMPKTFGPTFSKSSFDLETDFSDRRTPTMSEILTTNPLFISAQAKIPKDILDETTSMIVSSAPYTGVQELNLTPVGFYTRLALNSKSGANKSNPSLQQVLQIKTRQFVSSSRNPTLSLHMILNTRSNEPVGLNTKSSFPTSGMNLVAEKTPTDLPSSIMEFSPASSASASLPREFSPATPSSALSPASAPSPSEPSLPSSLPASSPTELSPVSSSPKLSHLESSLSSFPSPFPTPASAFLPTEKPPATSPTPISVASPASSSAGLLTAASPSGFLLIELSQAALSELSPTSPPSEVSSPTSPPSELSPLNLSTVSPASQISELSPTSPTSEISSSTSSPSELSPASPPSELYSTSPPSEISSSSPSELSSASPPPELYPTSLPSEILSSTSSPSELSPASPPSELYSTSTLSEISSSTSSPSELSPASLPSELYSTSTLSEISSSPSELTLASPLPELYPTSPPSEISSSTSSPSELSRASPPSELYSTSPPSEISSSASSPSELSRASPPSELYSTSPLSEISSSPPSELYSTSPLSEISSSTSLSELTLASPPSELYPTSPPSEISSLTSSPSELLPLKLSTASPASQISKLSPTSPTSEISSSTELSLASPPSELYPSSPSELSPTSSSPSEVSPTSSPSEVSPTSSPSELSSTLSHSELSSTLSHSELSPTSSPSEVSPASSPSEVSPTSSPSEVSPTSSPSELSLTSSTSSPSELSTSSTLSPSELSPTPSTSSRLELSPTSSPSELSTTSSPSELSPSPTSSPSELSTSSSPSELSPSPISSPSELSTTSSTSSPSELSPSPTSSPSELSTTSSISSPSELSPSPTSSPSEVSPTSSPSEISPTSSSPSELSPTSSTSSRLELPSSSPSELSPTSSSSPSELSPTSSTSSRLELPSSSPSELSPTSSSSPSELSPTSSTSSRLELPSSSSPSELSTTSSSSPSELSPSPTSSPSELSTSSTLSPSELSPTSSTSSPSELLPASPTTKFRPISLSKELSASLVSEISSSSSSSSAITLESSVPPLSLGVASSSTASSPPEPISTSSEILTPISSPSEVPSSASLLSELTPASLPAASLVLELLPVASPSEIPPSSSPFSPSSSSLSAPLSSSLASTSDLSATSSPPELLPSSSSSTLPAPSSSLSELSTGTLSFKSSTALSPSNLSPTLSPDLPPGSAFPKILPASVPQELLLISLSAELLSSQLSPLESQPSLPPPSSISEVPTSEAPLLPSFSELPPTAPPLQFLASPSSSASKSSPASSPSKGPPVTSPSTISHILSTITPSSKLAPPLPPLELSPASTPSELLPASPTSQLLPSSKDIAWTKQLEPMMSLALFFSSSSSSSSKALLYSNTSKQPSVITVPPSKLLLPFSQISAITSHLSQEVNEPHLLVTERSPQDQGMSRLPSPVLESRETSLDHAKGNDSDLPPFQIMSPTFSNKTGNTSEPPAGNFSPPTTSTTTPASRTTTTTTQPTSTTQLTSTAPATTTTTAKPPRTMAPTGSPKWPTSTQRVRTSPPRTTTTQRSLLNCNITDRMWVKTVLSIHIRRNRLDNILKQNLLKGLTSALVKALNDSGVRAQIESLSTGPNVTVGYYVTRGDTVYTASVVAEVLSSYGPDRLAADIRQFVPMLQAVPIPAAPWRPTPAISLRLKTVLRFVGAGDDLRSCRFAQLMEERLENAFAEAEAKVMNTDSSLRVQILSVSQIAGSPAVSLIYVVRNRTVALNGTVAGNLLIRLTAELVGYFLFYPPLITAEPLEYHNLNTSADTKDFWVITVIQDVENSSLEGQYQSFARLMEQRLAELFVVAHHQGARFKRATAVGSYTVQMVGMRRVVGPKNPAELTYYVQLNGTPLPGTTAAKLLNTVDSQTMALTLGYFVQLQAEAVIKGPSNNLWIIASVLAPIGIVTIIIIIITAVLCHKNKGELKTDGIGNLNPRVKTTYRRDVSYYHQPVQGFDYAKQHLGQIGTDEDSAPLPQAPLSIRDASLSMDKVIHPDGTNAKKTPGGEMRKSRLPSEDGSAVSAESARAVSLRGSSVKKISTQQNLTKEDSKKRTDPYDTSSGSLQLLSVKPIAAPPAYSQPASSDRSQDSAVLNGEVNLALKQKSDIEHYRNKLRLKAKRKGYYDFPSADANAGSRTQRHGSGKAERVPATRPSSRTPEYEDDRGSTYVKSHRRHSEVKYPAYRSRQSLNSPSPGGTEMDLLVMRERPRKGIRNNGYDTEPEIIEETDVDGLTARRRYGYGRQVKGHSETSTLSSQPSIDEVRQQMHLLLEEAFSLASAGHTSSSRRQHYQRGNQEISPYGPGPSVPYAEGATSAPDTMSHAQGGLQWVPAYSQELYQCSLNKPTFRFTQLPEMLPDSPPPPVPPRTGPAPRSSLQRSSSDLGPKAHSSESSVPDTPSQQDSSAYAPKSRAPLAPITTEPGLNHSGNPMTAVYSIPAGRPGLPGYFISTPPSSYHSPSWMSYPPEPEDVSSPWTESAPLPGYAEAFPNPRYPRGTSFQWNPSQAVSPLRTEPDQPFPLSADAVDVITPITLSTSALVQAIRDEVAKLARKQADMFEFQV